MKFKRGDSVWLKSEPTDSWFVIGRLNDGLYLIANVHSHERVVNEAEIESPPKNEEEG